MDISKYKGLLMETEDGRSCKDCYYCTQYVASKYNFCDRYYARMYGTEENSKRVCEDFMNKNDINQVINQNNKIKKRPAFVTGHRLREEDRIKEKRNDKIINTCITIGSTIVGLVLGLIIGSI